MARTDNLNNFLTDVASAIKEKKGDDTPISASNFDTEIINLPSGGSSKYAPRFISFSGCSEYDLDEEIANLDTSNIKSMASMFNMCQHLYNLDVSKFNTKNVRSMQSMFSNCQLLSELDVSNFNTENVTNMSNMFSGCKKVATLDVSNFVTTKVTGMSSMFYNCSLITTLDLSRFDFSEVTSISSMFSSCKNLTNLSFGANLGKGYTKTSANYSYYKLDLSSCTLLTHDSLMSVINNLYDLNLTYNVANGGTLYRQQLVLGSTNLAKLTEDEIAIATNKGWNVS